VLENSFLEVARNAIANIPRAEVQTNLPYA